MTRTQLGVAGALVAVAVIIVARRPPVAPHPHLAAQDQAPDGVDFKMQKIAAMAAKLDNLPPGKTPCETAFLQAVAFNQAAGEQGLTPPFPIPERGAFLDRCGGLPPEAQICMQPLYNMRHDAECEPIRHKYKGGDPLPPASGSAAAAPSAP
jgi:hypothetical protein